MKINKYFKYILFILIGLIVSLVLINLAFFDIITYKYEVNVQESGIGVNTNNDKIYFGSIDKNGISKRSLRIEKIPKDAMVYIKPYGKMSKYIKATDNNFLIKKESIREIEVVLDLSNSNIDYGKYTGHIAIFFLKVW